jgi:ATP adenylyltransferase
LTKTTQAPGLDKSEKIFVFKNREADLFMQKAFNKNAPDKERWEPNRIYWRMLVPFVSAIVALGTIICLKNKSISILNIGDSLHAHGSVFGFAIFTGYFAQQSIRCLLEIVSNMNKRGYCTLCDELAGVRAETPNDSYAPLVRQGIHILMEQDGFCVVPSIGPLNDHHLLITTRNHLTGMSQLSASDWQVLRSIQVRIRSFNQSEFGLETEFFEHGCADGKPLQGSACIAHAHIHAIGINQSLVTELVVNHGFVEGGLQIAPDHLPYLYYQDQWGHDWLKVNSHAESQFFRKLYAKLIGGSRDWNWRSAPNYNDMKRVIFYYSSIKQKKCMEQNTLLCKK